MRSLCFPTDQQLNFVLTGKFKATSSNWKHQHFFLGEYELFIVTEGTLYLSYNNENFTVSTGEYLLLPPCNAWRHGFKEAYSAFYWLHFSVDSHDIPRILPLEPEDMPKTNNFYTIPQHGSIPGFERIVVLMKQLQDMVKSNYATVALNAMTTTIITALYSQLMLLPPVNSSSTAQKQIYNDLIDYINTNIRKNLKISDIATTFGYNEKYLSHRFSEITGTPLKQYIIKAKIDSANFLLSDTNNSISQIALELGFSDNHNFARVYKKYTGLTPSEYRNAYSKRLMNHD